METSSQPIDSTVTAPDHREQFEKDGVAEHAPLGTCGTSSVAESARAGDAELLLDLDCLNKQVLVKARKLETLDQNFS